MLRRDTLVHALWSALVAGAMALAAAPAAHAGEGVVSLRLQPATPAAEPAKDAQPAEAPSSEKDAKKKDAKAPITGRATRMAVLNFGPPASWDGKVESTVGSIISSKAWRDAIPLLEKDKVDVVVVRINSGGGYALEVPKFHDLFEKEYKPRFRTVAWVESAISAAAMSPWVLEEFYFLPEGNIGACTMWSGDLVAAKGMQLELALVMMEKASAMGKHDSKIMRSMQIMEPLSANMNENGSFTFFQNLSGQYKINGERQILTFTSEQAMKYGFGKGVASTKEELAKVMGINEVEFAGEAAANLIDRNMRDNDRAEKQMNDLRGRYESALAAARASQGDRRKQEVGIARQRLNQLRQTVKLNPIFEMFSGMDREWFSLQEEILRELLKR
jgi:hypothetical protein